MRKSKAARRQTLREILCAGEATGARYQAERESTCWRPRCWQVPWSSRQKRVTLEGLWLGTKDSLAVISAAEWPRTPGYVVGGLRGVRCGQTMQKQHAARPPKATRSVNLPHPLKFDATPMT